jgi:hypothetical protein
MTKQINNDSNIKVVGKVFWQDFLHNLWISNKQPDTYTKDLKFSHFRDTKELVNE